MNYLIYGSSYKIIDQKINDVSKGRTVNSYSLEDVSLSDVLEDLCYNSMFEEEKIVVLKDIEVLSNSKKDNENGVSRLVEYLKNPNRLITLILIGKEKPSTRGALKEVIKHVELIETPVITKLFELVKLLGDKIKEDGYAISQNTLNTFAEKCALNYDVALNEFEKLKNIKGDNRLISEDDVENYVSNYNTSDIFSFKDAVINKDIKKASRMLDDLESSKMEVVPLVVMLEKEYSTVYNIKLLAKKGFNNDAISEKMNKMHPYRVKVLRDAGNKYSEQELEHIITYLCNLDLKVVSEDNLGFDELKKLLLEI